MMAGAMIGAAMSGMTGVTAKMVAMTVVSIGEAGHDES